MLLINTDEMIASGERLAMAIEIRRQLSQDEVLSSLYETKCLNSTNERPYRGALITIEQLVPEEVFPTQLYAIEENITTQQEIRKFLLEHHGEDILNMTYGGVEVVANGRTEILLPPIVEQSHQYDKPLLLDGTHRTLLATSLGHTAVGYITICDIDEEFDLAHRRVPNEWSDITTFTTLDNYLQARAGGFIHRKEGLGGDKSYRDFSHLIGKQWCGRA